MALKDIDADAAKKVQRAFRKQRRTGEALADAKGDQEVIDAVIAHDKATAAYGRAKKKASES